MRRYVFGSLIAVGTLALGCGSTETGTDAGVKDGGSGQDAGTVQKAKYTLNLTAFAPHEGKKVRLKLKSSPGGTTVGVEATATVTSGAASLVVADALEAGKNYNADFFVDLNDDGACSPCGTGTGEHAWRKAVAGQATDMTDAFAHNTTFTDISPY